MKKVIAVILALLCTGFVFSQEDDEVTQVSHWSFSTTVEAAIYPQSDYISGPTHFAPLTGFYSGAAGRIVGSASYTIPTPLGENWLLNSANLVLTGSGEITPVSFKACSEAAWTPLPFLVFSAGAQAGTGWNLAGLQGLAIRNSDGTYTDLPAFKSFFLKWWAQGTFQFDTGALIPGDWTHVQMMYTYQVYSEGPAGLESGDIYLWQCSGNKAKGLCNYQSLILAYQLPFVLNKVGVWTELNGHFNDSDYSNADYNGNFKSITVSPLALFNLTAKDTLTCVCSISSRRSYEETHTSSNVETELTYAGREWYFDKVGFNWSHNF